MSYKAIKVRLTLVSGYTLAPGCLSSFPTALLSCYSFEMLFCLNKQRRKSPVFGVSRAFVVVNPIDRFRSRTRTSKTTWKWRVVPMYGYATSFWCHFHVVFDVRVLYLNLSDVNSSPKGVEEISIFTNFPQSDSIEIFTKCLKIHTDQPEYKNLDYLLI
jgi:hypothetical protein